MPNKPTIADTAILGVEGLARDYKAGAHIKPHHHEAHQIIHGVAGVMRVLAEGGTWVVPPGRGLFVPARARHEIRCISLIKMRTVYLRGDHSAFPSDVRVIGVSDLMREILVRLAEGASASQVPHLSAILIDEIAASDVQSVRLPVPRDEKLARLSAELLAEPADTTPLTGWASRLAMSPRSLIRHIRSETGMSFRELRRQARIVAALERLALGQQVTSVAFDVGFESPSAFVQAFRTVIGTTPGRYMKQ